MKKLSFFVALLTGAVSAFAAQDTVSMVTYFPMPYVLYNNLTVTKQLDVGLGTQCDWEMGDDNESACPLTATTVNLWGTLRLRNFTRLTQTTGTTLGSTSSNTGAQLKFQNNLRVHSFENAPMTSVHTENLIVSGYDKLSVYSGRVNNPTYVMNQCTEGVHWEEITGKDNKSGVYLVCGTTSAPNTPCTCDGQAIGSNKNAEQSCKDLGYDTGSRYYKCTSDVDNSCSWHLIESCKKNTPPPSDHYVWYAWNSNYIFQSPTGTCAAVYSGETCCNYYFSQANLGVSTSMIVPASYVQGECSAQQENSTLYVFKGDNLANASNPQGALTCHYVQWKCLKV